MFIALTTNMFILYKKDTNTTINNKINNIIELHQNYIRPLNLKISQYELVPNIGSYYEPIFAPIYSPFNSELSDTLSLRSMLTNYIDKYIDILKGLKST